MGKYSLLLVSALIFSLLTYSYALKNALFQSNARTVQSFSQNQAHNIAQSGAMMAFNSIRNDSDSPFVPDSDETYSYPSTDGFEPWGDLSGSYRIDMVNQGDTLLVLQSTGQFEETEYLVTVGLFRSNGLSSWDGALIDKAIHAENNIDMGNGTVFGDVSLNADQGNMSLSGSIDGSFYFYDEDMEPGVVESADEGDDSGGNGKGKGKGNSGGGDDDGISGETVNMSEKIVHQDPAFPAFPTSYMPVDNNGGASYMYANDLKNKKFTNFTTNDTVINIGDEDVTLYAENIDLSGNLTIEGEGTLSIFVENNVSLGNGDVNAGNGSEHLGIYYKGTDRIQYTGNGSFSGLLFIKNDNVEVQIGGNPTFTSHIIHIGSDGDIVLNGTPAVSSLIYAPRSSVSLKGTGRPGSDFRGAIVSDTFSANGRASVIYDADFASTLPSLNQESDGDGSFTISYWN
jgi:hypothetical protein